MDLNTDRLFGLLPQYIPDSCLAGSGMKEKWLNMIVKSFKEVKISLYFVVDFHYDDSTRVRLCNNGTPLIQALMGAEPQVSWLED